MGAESFQTHSYGKTTVEAFDTAVNNAQYDYGHAGYTGTIAEKDGFIAYMTVPKGMSMDAIQEALEFYYEDNPVDPEFVKLQDHYGMVTAQNMVDEYNDKWGPAIAFPIGDDHWCFMGLASS